MQSIINSCFNSLFLSLFLFTFTISCYCYQLPQEFILVEPVEPQLYRPLLLFPFYPLDLKSQLILFTTFSLAISTLSIYLYRIEKEESLSEIMVLFLIQPVGFVRDLSSTLSFFHPNHDSRNSSKDSSNHKPITRLRRAEYLKAAPTFNSSPTNLLTSNHKTSTTKRAHTESSHYPGIHNTGNTCFFNSVVQALASTGELEKHLKVIVSEAENWDVVTPVTDALLELVTELNTPSTHRKAVYPCQLTSALSTLSQQNGLRSLVGAHQQQDSHELFILLASGISDEFENVLNEREKFRAEGYVGLKSAFQDEAEESTSNPHFNSAASLSHLNPFASTIAQRTSCLKCGYSEAIRLFKNEEFSLNVPERVYSCHLEDCLREMIQIERVEWFCHRCSLRESLDRVKSEIWRLENGDGEKKGKQTISASKKKRIREIKKFQIRLTTGLENNEHEDEFNSSLASLNSSSNVANKGNFKIERVLSTLSTKQIMVVKPPRVLALHLNRSNFSSSSFSGPSKNNCRVFFDEFLDLGRFVVDGQLVLDGRKGISDPEGLEDEISGNHLPIGYKPIWYKLQSIVVHYGGHSFGHYVSFRRRPKLGDGLEEEEELHQDLRDDSQNLNNNTNGVGYDFLNQGANGIPFKHYGEDENWSRISDDSVEKCHLKDVFNQNPFLAFYEKVDQGRIEGAAVREVVNGNGNGKGKGRPNENGNDEEIQLPKGLERLNGVLHEGGRVLERWQQGLKDQRGPSPSYQDEGLVH